MIDVDLALRRVEGAVEAYPKAGLFELAEEGFRSPFEILTACMISIRTKDETLMPIARRLFGQARSPTEMADLSVATIGELIQGCAFAARKAEQIHDIARFLSEHYRGELPCSRDLMLSFKGVGPKCANLALGIACGEPPRSPLTSMSIGSSIVGATSTRRRRSGRWRNWRPSFRASIGWPSIGSWCPSASTSARAGARAAQAARWRPCARRSAWSARLRFDPPDDARPPGRGVAGPGGRGTRRACFSNRARPPACRS